MLDVEAGPQSAVRGQNRTRAVRTFLPASVLFWPQTVDRGPQTFSPARPLPSSLGFRHNRCVLSHGPLRLS